MNIHRMGTTNALQLRVIWLRNRTVVNWLDCKGWACRVGDRGKAEPQPKVAREKRTHDDVAAVWRHRVKVTISQNVDGTPRYYRRVHGRRQWCAFVPASAGNPGSALEADIPSREPNLANVSSLGASDFWDWLRRSVIDERPDWARTGAPLPAGILSRRGPILRNDHHGIQCYCRLCKPDFRWAICDAHWCLCIRGCGNGQWSFRYTAAWTSSWRDLFYRNSGLCWECADRERNPLAYEDCVDVGQV